MSSRQATLRGQLFCDDEDPSQVFYVADVRYSKDFSCVCCFCVLFKTDMATTEKVAARALKKDSFADECVYDCSYVRRQIADYKCRHLQRVGL